MRRYRYRSMIRGVELYVGNVVRRWKMELRKPATEVLILSPYLTSDTADIVLKNVNPTICKIYTLFDAETFASGASSLGTIERLSNRGFVFYELFGLHAKIVLVPNRFATVGSQNLTRGGTVKREATIVLTDAATVEALHTLVAPWLREGRLITKDRIRELRLLLPKLTRRFRRLRKRATAMDKEVEAKIAARARARLQSLQSRLEKAPRSHGDVVVRVKRIENPTWDWDFLDSNATRSLLASAHDDLTRWLVKGETVTLYRMQRYICLNEDTGTIGWARVGKTRITFVENAVTGLTIKLAKWECKVGFTSVAWTKPSLEANLKITLAPKGTSDSLNIEAWFGLSKIQIIAIAGDRSSIETRELSEWISQHRSAFDRRILDLLLEPFQYEHNRTGVQADAFFGGVGTRYRLRLYEISGKSLLGAKKIG